MRHNINHIIEGCKQNNAASQTALFNMFYKRILNISLRYTSDEQHAKDIVQLSFIKIFKNISSHSPNNSIHGWIHRIVVNTAIDEIRKTKTKPHSVDINIVHLKVEEKEYSETSLDIILTAIDKLSPAYREVFELHVLKEYPHREIARMLGINEGTSKSNLFKAKAKLRDLLKDKLKEEYSF
jgi:RNA polymerase sigma-70 factor (ECF subfamily)